MNTAKPFKLIDRFNRHVDYVRLSVTDRCDFQCVYCMTDDMTFVHRSKVLTLEEMGQIAAAFVELGVSKIRLTGGEPLIRSNVMSLVEHIGQLSGLKELTLTSNASQLQKYAMALKAAGVKRINISLDSLDGERFHQITRTGRLEQVLSGIDAAIAAGFERIKLNTVILKGRNDDEILDLTRFAMEKGLDICFIEEMPLGAINEHSRSLSFFSSDEVKAVLDSAFTLQETAVQTNGPSRYYDVLGTKNRVGFISPHSHNFCSSCNRVRVTAEGRLLLCLGNEYSVDLRQVVREFPHDKKRLQQAIIDAMDLKPERHHFDVEDDGVQIVRFMNMTGG
ncbi:MAG: GTP 3',8-cyclase MoaA [Pseudomonadales bacterium]|nr:GTP 3',8-cyclase MoaA [Pseudomonadales bacterium]